MGESFGEKLGKEVIQGLATNKDVQQAVLSGAAAAGTAVVGGVSAVGGAVATGVSVAAGAVAAVAAPVVVSAALIGGGIIAFKKAKKWFCS